MVHMYTLVAAVSSMLVLTAGNAFAQVQIPGGPGVTPPVYSPYLNLLRSGSPANNYYGFVRPQLAATSGIQNLQQQLNMQQSAEKEMVAAGSKLPITGQQVFFLNTGGYFLNQKSGTAPTTSTITTRSNVHIPQAPSKP